jgi:uncharacterized protein
MRTAVVNSLASVSSSAWDGLAKGGQYPFLSHAFLRSLESCGVVGDDTAWLPRYVLGHEGHELVAAAPAYRRLDSYGEFVFDFRLAEVARRFGVRYYPKWTVASPFTPATGPRLLCANDDHRAGFAAAVLDHARADGASGVHVLFCSAEERSLLSSTMATRSGVQFHWRNDGYASFDDFLSKMRHEDRKQVKRERRRVAETGLSIQQRCAGDLSAIELARMYALYASTSDRKWGKPYLNEAWFLALPQTMPMSVVFCTAHEGEGDALAMTMSFEGNNALYGRYWGTFVDVPGLHFELCYYQLVDRAIAKGHVLVEAGAQGEHKFKRGFLPMITHSAHALFQTQFHDAVAHAFAEEAAGIGEERERMLEHSPFRADAAPPDTTRPSER